MKNPGLWMLRMNYEICPKRRINTKQGCLNHFVLRCGWCWPFYLQCYSRKWSMKGISYQTSQRHFLPEKERCHISHLPIISWEVRVQIIGLKRANLGTYRDISILYSSLNQPTNQPTNLPTFCRWYCGDFWSQCRWTNEGGIGYRDAPNI